MKELDLCLLCGHKVVESESGYKCSNPQCTLEIPASLDGVTITHKMVNQLLDGQQIKQVGFHSAVGKKYQAALALSEAGRLHKVIG